MHYEFIGFNFNVPLLRNRLFRDALRLSFDADELIAQIYLNHALRTDTPVNPDSWLYETSVSTYACNPEYAASLIERVKAGETDYEGDPGDESRDGAETEPEGGPEDEADNEAYAGPAVIPILRLMTNEENPERVKVIKMIAEAFSAIGVDTFLDIVPFEKFNERLNAGEYDIFIGAYRLSLAPDPSCAFSGTWARDDETGNKTNVLSYDDPELDRLMDEAYSARDEEDYLLLYSEIQKRIASRLPVISLAFRKTAVITDIRVNGEIRPNADNVFSNINEWTLSDMIQNP
jgi:peptide/nickel transport system substrate-binding protein